MGKLGKKARKFAKKNLQSVLKRKRQINSMILKKHAKQKGGRGGGGGGAEDHVKAAPVPSNERIFEDVGDTSLDLDLIFSEDDSDMEDGSESDGFLSEDPDCAYNIGSERDNDSGKDGSTLLEQNKDIQQELAKEKKRLERLREKDPDIIKFLEEKRLEQIKSESDGEEEMSDEDIWDADEDGSNLLKEKLFTVSAIDSWKKEVMEEQKYSALPNLLNAYRSVCHYGTEDDVDAFSSHRVQSSDTFCNVALFMLQESDGIFRKLLVLCSSNNKVETILGLKTSAKWKNAEPLIKSYLSSTLFLLNHVSDSEILVFSLTRLKASVVFFAAFPSLLRKFIKVAVYLWSTCVGPVSSSAFLVVQNISLINSNCLDTCLVKAYKAFITHCKVVEPSNLTHLQFLLDSLVKLYSLDVPNSFNKAQKSIQQLARILQRGIKTKKKEVLKRIYNWQYTNCIDLWVKFISANIKDHDLQSLLYVLIQVINGVAHLFPGPRYLPLRLKCIQMINQLSSSTGLFVPVTSLVLDCLDSIETTKPKPDERLVNDFNVSAVLKVPKQWLKVKYFQEELVKQVIELLAAHFSQWCLHITFPDLATFPLIRLRTFYEKLSTENLRRPVKRLIDQVQQNIEFVQKKRDEAAFSPKDLDSIETFVQVNRSGGNLPFVQYYENIVKKPAPLSTLKKTSDTKVKKTVVGDAQKGSGKVKRKSPIDGSKRKKQKKKNMHETDSYRSHKSLVSCNFEDAKFC